MINIRLAVHSLIQSRTVVPSYGGFNRGIESPVIALCHVRDAAVSVRGGDDVSVSLVNYTSSVVLDQVAAKIASTFYEALDVRTPFLIVFSEDSLGDVLRRPEFASAPASYVLGADAFKKDVEELDRSEVEALQLGVPIRVYAISSGSKHLEALVSVSSSRAKFNA